MSHAAGTWKRFKASLKSYYVLFSCWTDPKYVSYRVRRLMHRDLDTPATLSRPTAGSRILDELEVDIVYLWVSGNDPVYRERRDYWAAKLGRPVSRSVHKERFVEVDELRYSLRSIELHAPWIRRVFLVTDRQTPEWIVGSHPKLTIVDQNTLFPDEGWLPCFNSAAIESQLHRIPGLSEYYLTANDDTFFGQPVTPADFFEPQGNPHRVMLRVMNDPGPDSWIGPWRSAKGYHERLWLSEWNATKWAIERRWPFHRVRKLDSHQIHGMTKTIQRTTVERFPAEYRRTSRMRFRALDNLSILRLARQYSLLAGLGVEGWVDSRVYRDEEALNQAAHAGVLPPLFCVNSNSGDRESARQVFERIFPLPSSFEMS